MNNTSLAKTPHGIRRAHSHQRNLPKPGCHESLCHRDTIRATASRTGPIPGLLALLRFAGVIAQANVNKASKRAGDAEYPSSPDSVRKHS